MAAGRTANLRHCNVSIKPEPLPQTADYERWIGSEPNPHDLLITFPAEPMKMWPISKRVNNPRNDDEGLLAEMELAAASAGLKAKIAAWEDNDDQVRARAIDRRGSKEGLPMSEHLSGRRLLGMGELLRWTRGDVQPL
jgi:hypothetical protein